MGIEEDIKEDRAYRVARDIIAKRVVCDPLTYAKVSLMFDAAYKVRYGPGRDEEKQADFLRLVGAFRCF